MSYAKWELGNLRSGQMVAVTLRGSEANVRLMDRSNFYSFARGQRHRDCGGHAQRGPVSIDVPSDGDWVLVVDHGGYVGNTEASVRVI